eukprot:Hpha_TRINITY_DN15029_c5_g12::TRINITY_DN15029_c5_g12_i1::g.125588::m.125588
MNHRHQHARTPSARRSSPPPPPPRPPVVVGRAPVDLLVPGVSACLCVDDCVEVYPCFCDEEAPDLWGASTLLGATAAGAFLVCAAEAAAGLLAGGGVGADWGVGRGRCVGRGVVVPGVAREAREAEGEAGRAEERAGVRWSGVRGSVRTGEVRLRWGDAWVRRGDARPRVGERLPRDGDTKCLGEEDWRDKVRATFAASFTSSPLLAFLRRNSFSTMYIRIGAFTTTSLLCGLSLLAPVPKQSHPYIISLIPSAAFLCALNSISSPLAGSARSFQGLSCTGTGCARAPARPGVPGRGDGARRDAGEA